MDIFVFGSNLAGRHGKGAALEAYQKHGAIYGRGEGLQGASYAIPTKSQNLLTLPIDSIANNIYRFLIYARTHPQMTFHLTAIGTGLAGYTVQEIAPIFADIPQNVILPKSFADYLAYLET